MAGFVEGVDRGQGTLLPALLDDYVAEDNPVRAVDVFVDGLDLDKLGFGRPRGVVRDDQPEAREERPGAACRFPKELSELPEVTL